VKPISYFATVLLVALLAGCEGDDGDDGAAGAPGADGAAGADGLSSLTRQTDLALGSAQCPQGGVLVESGQDLDADGVLSDAEVTESSSVCSPNATKNFVRIATFLSCRQFAADCDDDTETLAEIVAASEDGLTLIYTDSPGDQIGFVDITDPAAPAPGGFLGVGGEPTSVAVAGPYALVGVNTSPDFINPSGSLAVVDIAAQTIVETIDLGGQPDAVAVSPDGAYAAIAIENERDEDLGDGRPEQLPSGFVVIVDLAGDPAAWTTLNVNLDGVPTLFPNDPEPEFVDINADNIVVVSLQENNHLVLIDATDGSIVNDFSGGVVDMIEQVDLTEEDPAIISQTETAMMVPREADGVAWINTSLFATADEGDLDGGSRGFTVYNTSGDVVFTAGNALDHATARLGHYPDGRSGNKGNEPENAEFGSFDGDDFLFVNSERSSLSFVYNVNDPANPQLAQILPTALGPEGALAIPSRNLLVIASEEDARDDKFRGGLNIYSYMVAEPTYPTLVSADRPDGTPIAWSAMSGLAADTGVDYQLYSIEDSFYGSNRIFVIDVSTKPAMITDEITITDANDVFAAFPAVGLADPNVPADDATRAEVFDEADLDALINDDKTINIDPEGIAQASGGGFWIASEGNGSVPAQEAGRPINSRNFIFKTDAAGVIESVVTLPDAINDAQRRFGFEGIAEFDGAAYVAFQRPWSELNDPADNVRIGIYDVGADAWTFLLYPLDAATSPAGGWVGLSDITALGGGEFLVLERDNQGGPDARIKRLYRIDVTGLNDGDAVTKSLVRDLLAEGDLTATGGLAAEKVEGATVTLGGDVYLINDNDGVDDNSGETQLINLGAIL
jgi:hypothetical protein